MKRISEDIFAEWRKHRFVLVEPDMHEELGHMVVLTDFKFWAENIGELMSWCNVNGGGSSFIGINLDSTANLLTRYQQVDFSEELKEKIIYYGQRNPQYSNYQTLLKTK